MPNPIQQVQEVQRLLNVIDANPDALAAPDPGNQLENEVRGRVDNFRLPPGAADVTAFQDFTTHVMAAENAYVVPINPEPQACLPIAQQAFQNAMQLITAIARTQGLRFDISEADLADLRAKQQADLVKCVLKDAANTVLPTSETLTLSGLRQIGEGIDSLVDVDGYEFDIFEPNTINVGVRLVYRQEWTPLWYQVGELLSTIPLVPGEKIRYETKTWQTTRTTEERTDTTSLTSERSTTATERDVREIAKQTSTKFGVKVEGNGSANLGVAQVGGSSSTYADHARESRRSKQSFQEFMRKSAETLRNERRISVTVTREEGNERRVTRELSNPNDEVTVSYLFYELQRVYRVRQYLQNVIPVVYVAMDIPAANEITEEWIVAHDWILAGAILDTSFLEPLSFISTDLPGLEEAFNHAKSVFDQALGVVEDIRTSIRATEDDIEDASGLGDVVLRVQMKSLSGKLKAATDSLHKAEETMREAGARYREGKRKLTRLQNHIRQNILHYMQAKWAAEVPEQRYLRLRSIPYPNARRNPNGQLVLDGWLPLADVVDTNHPLGYIGNYVIFQLTRDDNALINDLAAFYLSQEGAPADPDARDPDEEAIEIVTPANAVHVEALPGAHSLLEPFKLRHRMHDAEKARQEALSIRLDNLRKLMLLHNDRLGDPSVEKLVITDGEALGRMVEAVRAPQGE